MPTVSGAIALHSSLCTISSDKPSLPNHVYVATKPKNLLQNHPLYTPTNAKLSIQFKEKILCLEILGIDAGKALSQNPELHTATMESIHSIISFLISKGIHQKDLPRIFGMCPKILTSNIKTDLNPVFYFLLQDLQVQDHNFRKVVKKNPRLLTSSVINQLKPALFYLKKLGFKDLAALAYQDSILLVSNVEGTLIPKLMYLESLGFSKDEARFMVLRCPSLFTFSIENNFQPKFEYFDEEMGGKLEELKEFPQYFAFSLENRIKPRYLEVVESGIHLPLSVMLKSTDEDFRELIKKGGG
ncbi:PREDICTED: transcription termination factor MTEF1, chloroplastic-like [Lupinus angustifolius]|uniref:transcription termination factor MTEF1, chloroplastic-like n=1 Tax=Lupinus angustifolius TaxID=3871 RepID=UPI00092EB9DD|nr:PREDICTED: transcription termination factor MTEF1, chloroplastic-like [Lupinus angustifolius]